MASAGISTEYLLKSNIVPSPREELAVQQTLNRINDDLLAIEREIAGTRAILADLEARRDLITAERKPYLNVLSPVRRLPLEIIGHFLQLSLPKKMDRGAQMHVLNRYNVCRTWRQAALSTPSLWSVLDIQLDEYLERDSELNKNVKKGIYEWIRRSGLHPLTLSFSSVAENRHLLPRFVNWLPDKSRWKEVTICQSRSKDLSFFASLFSSHAWDLLEYLELQSYPTHMNQAHPIVLHNARNLKRLKLCIPSWAIYAQIPFTPWSQLLELHIQDFISVTPSLIILEECRNLQICMLSIFVSADDPPDHPRVSSPLLLPHLRQLTLTMDHEIGPFLLSLKLPNLKEFILACDPDDKFAPHSIVEFIQTSRCPIRKMVFEMLILEDDDDLAIILAEMKSLVELQLGFVSGIHGSFLYQKEVKEALQNLKVLVIKDARLDFDQYSLQNFAEYCYDREIVNLKYIKLEILRDDIVPNMQSLMDKGLTVEIIST